MIQVSNKSPNRSPQAAGWATALSAGEADFGTFSQFQAGNDPNRGGEPGNLVKTVEVCLKPPNFLAMKYEIIPKFGQSSNCDAKIPPFLTKLETNWTVHPEIGRG